MSTGKKTYQPDVEGAADIIGNKTFEDDVSIEGDASFDNPVTIPETPVADTDASSKGYVDDRVFSSQLAWLVLSITDGSTVYAVPYYPVTDSDVTDREIVIAEDCDISSLFVETEHNYLTNGLVITLMKNGAATALTVSLAEGVLTGADVAHSVSFSAGDTLSMRFQAASGDYSADQIKAAVKVTTTL